MNPRLLGAAALCALALGVGWANNAGTAGYTMGGYQYQYNYSSTEGGYVYEYTYNPVLNYMPGMSATVSPGASSDVRVVLVPAIAAFLWAADPLRRHARRAARAAVGGAVVLVALALSRGLPAAALVAVGAVVLAWPASGFRSLGVRRRVQTPQPAPVVAPVSAGSTF